MPCRSSSSSSTDAGVREGVLQDEGGRQRAQSPGSCKAKNLQKPGKWGLLMFPEGSRDLSRLLLQPHCLLRYQRGREAAADYTEQDPAVLPLLKPSCCLRGAGSRAASLLCACPLGDPQLPRAVTAPQSSSLLSGTPLSSHSCVCSPAVPGVSAATQTRLCQGVFPCVMVPPAS